MKDLRVSLQDGQFDLLMENGKFAWAEDGTAVAGQVLVRLQKVLGESIYSPSSGVDWYGIIFKANVPRAEKDIELKRAVLSTPGVNGIASWTWTQTGHTVRIDATIITDYGTETIAGDITPL